MRTKRRQREESGEQSWVWEPIGREKAEGGGGLKDGDVRVREKENAERGEGVGEERHCWRLWF